MNHQPDQSHRIAPLVAMHARAAIDGATTHPSAGGSRARWAGAAGAIQRISRPRLESEFFLQGGTKKRCLNKCQVGLDYKTNKRMLRRRYYVVRVP